MFSNLLSQIDNLIIKPNKHMSENDLFLFFQLTKNKEQRTSTLTDQLQFKIPNYLCDLRSTEKAPDLFSSNGEKIVAVVRTAVAVSQPFVWGMNRCKELKKICPEQTLNGGENA